MTKSKTNNLNKRGDVPVVVLVIGVIAICLLALVSFYISDRTAKKGFNIEIVESAAIAGEKINFYRNSLGFSETELNELFDIKPADLEGGRNILLQQEGIRVRYNVP